MDFMKVFDQTVREIKREVNLKVLKVPEIEQKVLDATDDEPWGPHGSALSEIAHATKKFSECQMIMNVLWTRLTEGSARWRHAYKALTVIEYLIANGSERAVDDILEHSSQISVLLKFEYVETNGKDTGINVRKKVETIMNLVNDKEKIKAVRDKAASNRDKYVGLSSSGISFKSSSSVSSQSLYSNYSSSDRYGSLGGTREESSFKDSYKKEDSSSRERKKSSDSKERIKKGGIRNQDVSLKAAMKADDDNNNNDDDDDFDFDPRGSNKSGTKNTTNNNNNTNTISEVDLFGPNLMDDFLDLDSNPAQNHQSNPKSEIEEKSEDFFADADFQSAPPVPKPQNPMDLFGSISSPPDLFSTPNPTPNPKSSKPESVKSDPFDPFASIPMTNTFTSDPFGDFTSNTTNKTSSQNETLNSLNPSSDDGFGTFASAGSVNTASGIANTGSGIGSGIGKSGNKGGFQVKSGIWAESLSKGLIDLNITAPKKVNLSDIGIVGGLDDEKDIFSSYYTGSTGGSSNLSGFGQNQFGQNQFGGNQFGGFK